MVARLFPRLERRASCAAGAARSRLCHRRSLRGPPGGGLPARAPPRPGSGALFRREHALRRSVPASREWLLLALALGLSLAPHWIPAMGGALLLALFLPGRALLRCFTRRAPGFS